MEDKPSPSDPTQDAADALQQQLRQQKQAEISAAIASAQAARQPKPAPVWWPRVRRYLPGIAFSISIAAILAVADYMHETLADEQAPPTLPAYLSPYRAAQPVQPHGSIAPDTIDSLQP